MEESEFAHPDGVSGALPTEPKGYDAHDANDNVNEQEEKGIEQRKSDEFQREKAGLYAHSMRDGGAKGKSREGGANPHIYDTNDSRGGDLTTAAINLVTATLFAQTPQVKPSRGEQATNRTSQAGITLTVRKPTRFHPIPYRLERQNSARENVRPFLVISLTAAERSNPNERTATTSAGEKRIQQTTT